MRVLVTGGGGFLGQALCRGLVERGHDVSSFNRGHYPELDAIGVRQLRGDLADRDAVIAACAGMDAVLHNAAKAGEHMLAHALRLELNGEKVRVIEVAPGMVRTEEFSLVRLGDQDAADAVYDGVENPLTAEDVADAVVWTLTRPHHFNVDLMVIRPIAQAAQHKVARNKGL